MSESDLHALQHPISGVVVVVLVDYLRQHQGWGWLRLMAGSAALRNTPGLLFAKVMGSGHEGGFSLRPSASHQGVICCFDTWRAAMEFWDSAWVAALRERARESWRGAFAVQSARGQWDQQSWTPTQDTAFSGAPPPDAHPNMLGVLTRASIRPAKAVAFWRHAPPAQADLVKAPGCELSIGLGEAPLLRQCTLSVWQDTDSMTQYAHHQAHQQAIQAAYRHQFFSESLFVRMKLLRMQGVWKSRPLDYSPAPAPGAAHVQ